MRKENREFIGGALMLSLVSVILRGIGVSFSAYLNRKIGGESMGLFTLVMSVYGFAVTLALACGNLGAVRLTSERCAALAEKQVDRASWRYAMRRIVRSVCGYSLIFGLSSGFLLYVFSGSIAEHLLHDLRTVRSLRVLALSLPAISLSSAFSGYFTGLRKVSRNAVVSVSELLARILITTTALAVIAPGDVEAACLAVVGGSALAEAWSLALQLVLYLLDSGKPSGQRYGNASVKLPAGLRQIASVSLPCAFGACARQGLNTLEHLAIPAGLRKNGLTQEQTLKTYGQLQGIAFPLVMFPYAVIGAFTSLLVPEMAALHELGDREKMAELTERVYRASAVFSVGACGIFLNFAGELGELIYHSQEAALYTFLMGGLVPFMYLDTAVDSLLKGMGEQVYTMKVNLADSLVGLLLVMTAVPLFGIGGYIAAVWLCEIGNLTASILRLGKLTGKGIRQAAHCYGRPALTGIALSAVCRAVMKRLLPPTAAMLIWAGAYVLLNLPGKRKKRDLHEASLS